MNWSSVLVAFGVSHLSGDLLLQTEWQATRKSRGLADPEGRRALRMHGLTYASAYLPALVWIAREGKGVPRAIEVALAVTVPHVLIDDGHVVPWWLKHVKHVEHPDRRLMLLVDQSMHVVCLLGAALLAVA